PTNRSANARGHGTWRPAACGTPSRAGLNDHTRSPPNSTLSASSMSAGTTSPSSPMRTSLILDPLPRRQGAADDRLARRGRRVGGVGEGQHIGVAVADHEHLVVDQVVALLRGRRGLVERGLAGDLPVLAGGDV